MKGTNSTLGATRIALAAFALGLGVHHSQLEAVMDRLAPLELAYDLDGLAQQILHIKAEVEEAA